ncbi:MAG: exodeoxyribonuclease VII large subunit [Paludibacteraceae bacterium]|nr:exodeoxyribonuclease VII large subunit [Paludibacteraceae bacterium]
MNDVVLGLYDLNAEISNCVSAHFSHPVWVAAEVVGLSENRTGHCYLELMEKNDAGVIVAKAKATIWASLYKQIKPYFLRETGMPLAVGMTVALLVEVVFHPSYGPSLNVKDINPSFTLGNRLLQRNQVINRLHNEGVFDRNKELALPLLTRKIAVVTAQTAAGYGDFMNELTQNPWGFRFEVTLFPALVQGELAEASMVKALHEVAKQAENFDAVVIIRGGGSVADLACFDGYELAYTVTEMLLPVIAGIGHDRDVSVLDMVAAISLKTPTAVAQFLVQKMAVVHQQVMGYQDRLTKSVQQLLQRQNQRLQTIEMVLPLSARRCIERKEHRLQLLERSLDLLSPQNVLKKGYTMTLKNGALASLQDLHKGDEITTVFHNGTVASVVK